MKSLSLFGGLIDMMGSKKVLDEKTNTRIYTSSSWEWRKEVLKKQEEYRNKRRLKNKAARKSRKATRLARV